MREVVLTVPAAVVEEVLDRLLPIVAGGVREVAAGPQVELRMRGGELPSLVDLERAVARWPHSLAEREVSDDWRQRRLADYEQDVIGGRLVVRPPWAPAPTAGLLDIPLSESTAFGAGTHPTTRTCLELLLDLEPAGSFVDLGCGTGVLAILAARLGWKPVIALDVEPDSVEAARENAQLNAVPIELRVVDLSAHAPPPADAFAANFTAALHASVAAGWTEPVPRIGLLSGYGTDAHAAVAEAYAARGLRERRRIDSQGWVVAILKRD